jgi:hypothetical protein
MAVSLEENNCFFPLRIKLHALIQLGVSPPSLRTYDQVPKSLLSEESFLSNAHEYNTQNRGANPTTLSYNASAVKIYMQEIV